MILIVTYDLRGPRDYTSFYESLKAQGTWWHYITSTWLLSTPKSPGDVFQALAPHMDEKDYVLVAEMGSEHNGWLPAKAWEWIRQQQAVDALRKLMPLANTPPPPARLSDLMRQTLPRPVPPSLGDILKPSAAPRSLSDRLLRTEHKPSGADLPRNKR